MTEGNGGPPIIYWLGVASSGKVVEVRTGVTDGNVISPDPDGPDGNIIGTNAIGPEVQVQGEAQTPVCWIQLYDSSWVIVPCN